MDSAVSISILSKIEENVSKVIVGKRAVTRMLLAAVAAGGHVLLEDVPGTGKTVLAKALAKSMGCAFDRVQFTPDLLPSDVTGLSFFNQEKAVFTFKEGPVFTNILLADEINRATPRTQSSLLECMAEGQVTVDGETRILEAPFFVIATQNPVETIGCFPLPEAQLDRFLIKIRMGGLTRKEERQMLDRFINAEPLAEIQAVCSVEDIRELQCACRQVYVHDDLRDYIVALVQDTRKNNVGVSPRGTLAFLRVSQGYALVQGRDYVVPEDIKETAHCVLCHRLIGEFDETQKDAVVTNILNSVELPTEDWSKR
ncbi:MAG: MoxR family ATPase [Lachnospiraceae bacterium]|nr:MoxR family ATPase [Lachnospiraceae bacterium]